MIRALVLVVAVALAAPSLAQSARCKQPGAQPSAETPVTSKLEVGQKQFVLRFDDSRDRDRQNISLPATPLLPALAGISAEVEEDLRSEQFRTIAADEIEVVPSLTKRRHLRLCVSLDPRQVGARPGRYQGNVVVSGGAVEAAAVPITVTFRSSKVKAITLAVVGTLIGLLLKVFGELAAGRKGAKRAALERYLKSWTFIGTALAAPVLAWAGYYVVYQSNVVWGAGDVDSLKLFATCLGYQLGGVAVADLLKTAVGR